MYLCYLVLFIFQNPGKSRKVQDGKSIIKAKYIKPIVFFNISDPRCHKPQIRNQNSATITPKPEFGKRISETITQKPQSRNYDLEVSFQKPELRHQISETRLRMIGNC